MNTEVKKKKDNSLSKTELSVLHYYCIGYGTNDIMDQIDIKERTIDECRRNLFKAFSVSTILQLTKRAYEYGYGNAIIEKLEGMQAKFKVIRPLNLWEIQMLHLLIDEVSFDAIIDMYPFDQEEMLQMKKNLFAKLKIITEFEILFHAILTGYIEIVPIDPNEIPAEKISKAFGEWVTEEPIVKLKQYRLEKRYHLCERVGLDD